MRPYFPCGYSTASFLAPFTVICCLSSGAEIREELQWWRGEILADQWNIVRLSDESEHLEALETKGPNILPDLFNEFQNECDNVVLRSYSGLIRRLGHFQSFRYYPYAETNSEHAYDVRQGLPLLHEEVDEFGISIVRGRERVNIEKQQLLQLWSECGTYVNRTELKDKLRDITGVTSEEWWKLDRGRIQEIQKINIYGIYNLPYMFDLIAEENNAIMFAEFIRLVHIEVFNALHMHGKLPGDAQLAHAAYPTTEEKLALICDWWENVKSTYTELNDLYLAIDCRVEAYRTKIPTGPK